MRVSIQRQCALNHPTYFPSQAQQVLQHFLDHALPQFGDFQDAMWQDQPFLNHSLLASSLNLKLLNPLDVIRKAEERYLSASERAAIRQQAAMLRT